MLVIVGQNGWKSEAFFERLATHSYRQDILLTGFIEKKLLPQAYHHSLALIYPSIYEGFGFPVLEAMACGTNVICPNNSSLPEVGGDLAFYYPTQDINALTSQMVLVSSRGEDVKASRSRVAARAATFSWTKYVEIFNAYLDSLA